MFSHFISSWHKLASTLSHYWFCQSSSAGDHFHRLLSSAPSSYAPPFSPLLGLSPLPGRPFSLVSCQQLISDDWKGGWLLSVDFLSWDWLRMCVRSERFFVESFQVRILLSSRRYSAFFLSCLDSLCFFLASNSLFIRCFPVRSAPTGDRVFGVGKHLTIVFKFLCVRTSLFSYKLLKTPQDICLCGQYLLILG